MPLPIPNCPILQNLSKIHVYVIRLYHTRISNGVLDVSTYRYSIIHDSATCVPDFVVAVQVSVTGLC